jgi:type VI secretion system protein ImpC
MLIKRIFSIFQNLIAGIDEQLSRQVNQILHHDEFQKLESAWRGLSYLVNNSETDETMQPNGSPPNWPYSCS